MAITRVTPIRELKRIFIETFLNKTSKVTKVSDESIVNGLAYGTSKIGQKALKEISLVESHLFPDDAFGGHLDIIAQRSGVSPRFSASASSTYIRLVADPGTVYSTTNIFFGQGINFELTEDVTVGALGFAYAKVRSQDTGIKSNIPSLTLTTVNPAPSGHIAVANEYEAVGGRDVESDQLFRLRIKNGANLAARGTLEFLLQTLLKFNEDILNVYYSGVNDQNQHILAVSTQNGIDLTSDELSQLLTNITPYLSLGEYNAAASTTVNVVLQNIEYQYVDVDFRLELVQNANVDEARRDIQIGMTKYLDPRFWRSGDRVEWDDLLEIVKETRQVKYVLDSFFNPRIDLTVDPSRLPRIRGFIMRDLEGNIIQDIGGIISPTFYPSESDVSFQTTIIR